MNYGLWSMNVECCMLNVELCILVMNVGEFDLE